MQDSRFLLRGISHTELVEKYLSREFLNRRQQEENSLISISAVESIINPELEEKYDKNIFLPIHSDGKNIFASTGHQSLKIFYSQSKSTSKRCDFCKNEFSNDEIGYPLYHKSETFLTSKQGQNYYENVEIFWVQGGFCSYNCVLAYVDKYLVNSINLEMRNSRYLLLNLFNLQYPNQKLISANDPKLLLKEDGSLTEEQFRKYNYLPTNKHLLVPILSYHQRFEEKSNYSSIQEARDFFQR